MSDVELTAEQKAKAILVADRAEAQRQHRKHTAERKIDRRARRYTHWKAA